MTPTKAELSSQLGKLQAELETANNTISEQKLRIDELEQGQTAQPAEASAEISMLQGSIEILQESLAEERASLREARATVTELSSELEQSRSDCQAHKAKVELFEGKGTALNVAAVYPPSEYTGEQIECLKADLLMTGWTPVVVPGHGEGWEVRFHRGGNR